MALAYGSHRYSGGTTDSPIRNGFQISTFVPDEFGVGCLHYVIAIFTMSRQQWPRYGGHSPPSRRVRRLLVNSPYLLGPKEDVVHCQFWTCQRRSTLGSQPLDYKKGCPSSLQPSPNTIRHQSWPLIHRATQSIFLPLTCPLIKAFVYTPSLFHSIFLNVG